MNHYFKITYYITFLFLLTSCHSFSQKKEDDYTAKIDSLIKTTNVRQFNGTILIAQNGKSKYSKAYGYSNFENKLTLKIDDQFEIMSNSKQVTAVLILKEVEKGKIDLQSPIKKYLPNLTQTWADTVTVHQLLNFTAGIPEDLDKTLLFKPGTDFKYGNTAFTLLGKIVEFSTKRAYSEVANELFKELKMKNTFCFEKDNNQNLVSGYLNSNNTFKVLENKLINSENLSADGIISTVNDLTIWDNNLHKGKILKPESYKLMTRYSITAQHDVFGKEKVGYGYGIRIIDNEPIKYLGHTGMGNGFLSTNLYFTGKDVTIVVLENQMNEKMELGYYFEIEIKKIVMNSELMQ
ncbi:beta-lactamase family protein [Flavobacterium sp. ZT3R18]|uniref:serine hydrolase domain-containing protein n=1 Tax=Flavobacterium sp. ZT3R18 TaxID=2594429 RepID=UPI00117AB2B5|nr:serine hydrolase domain-containing protein [Flavobacterium sp. ZT3R18]TRX35097.1 beta-lactamase family protein [Flavobacterium sp. ZT3R18]